MATRTIHLPAAPLDSERVARGTALTRNAEPPRPTQIPGHAEASWWICCTALILFGWEVQTFIGHSPRAEPSLPGYLLDSLFDLGLAFAGIVIALLFRRLPLAWYRGAGFVALGLALVALILVLAVGEEINGARRWLNIFGFSFQPLEFAKLALIVGIAALYTPNGPIARALYTCQQLVIGAVVIVMLGLVAAQPNLSGVAIAGLIALGMGWAGGLHRGILAGVVALALVLFGLVIALDSERSDRFSAVVAGSSEVDHDVKEEQYQATQARYAIASGGWWGLGTGHSRVKSTLPASDSDFIFAILVEEYGIVGGLAVIGVLAGLVLWVLALAARCPERFLQLVGFGIALHWGIQTLVNLQVNLGGVTTGVPLLFFSKGGSAMLVLGMEIGIVALIAQRVDALARAPRVQVVLERAPRTA